MRRSGWENGTGANVCKQIWGGWCPSGDEVGGGGAGGKRGPAQLSASKFGEGGAPEAMRLAEGKRVGSGGRGHSEQVNLRRVGT